MVWRRIFRRSPEPEDSSREASNDSDSEASHSVKPSENPPDSGTNRSRSMPPHMQRAIEQHQRPAPRGDDPRERLATLRRRRTAVLYDIEQGEMAHREDNPWKQRVALLGEALETVEQDRKAAGQVEPAPFHPLDSTPIQRSNVGFENDVAIVTFTIGNEAFVYEEPLDWAERGHQVTRGELARTSGSSEPLLPTNLPEELREPLRNHLDLSLFVFASELRDRALNDEPLPDHPTLADLAPPCATCGGWTDYLGRCQHCARRNARIQELDRERGRLMDERSEELEEEHRMAERLPVARRRLADIDTEIAKVERQVAENQ